MPKDNYIKGSYSIDPSILQDTDSNDYMYFGGLWGGQLHRWNKGTYNANLEVKDVVKNNQPALSPKVVKLHRNMTSFAEQPKDVQLLDESGKPILAGDVNRKFFEGAWVSSLKESVAFVPALRGAAKMDGTLVSVTAVIPSIPFCKKFLLEVMVSFTISRI